jgi:hypothetical protein
MLEAFVEEPPRAAEKAPLPDKEKTSETISVPNAGNLPPRESVRIPAANKAERIALRDQPRGQCPKCESTRVIRNIMIRNRGQESDGKLSIYLDADPDALIFKNRFYAELLADVCGECGHVELRAQNPHDLYNHYLQSKVK